MLAALLRDKKSIALVEGNLRVGAKIAVSGGGRCNLTNSRLQISRYRGDKQLLKEVFKRYDERWLLRWFHDRGVQTRLEKGTCYFAKGRSRAVIEALKGEIRGVNSIFGFRVQQIIKDGASFRLISQSGRSIRTNYLVIASGGLSYPKLGASDIGFKTAREMGHAIAPTAPALVGFTLQREQAFFKSLSGIALEANLYLEGRSWRDSLLFAHRGLSGPAALNASLWWERGSLSVDLLPDFDLRALRSQRKRLSTLLPMPKRAAQAFLEALNIKDSPYDKLSDDERKRLESLHEYRFAPAGTFGYSKAEVTRGGVVASQVDPLTMMSKIVPRLYFIGEVLDVTGELGGYNFQWAFSSAAVCAEALNSQK